MQHRLLRALMMLFTTHSPPSYGHTPLKLAIACDKTVVAVFLRSVGAPE
jgi:hypothetical protein